MTEKIGKVTLDYTYYPGEDKYTDGDIEDEILEVVKTTKPEHFPEIIEEKKSWTYFYHLSQFRSNIIDWLPIKKSDRVLEIGSGCGAITATLAKKAGSVTCVDLSKKRSLINAYRNQEYDNVNIMVGNFSDIEPHLATDYEYVLLIGVFEYGQSYIGGKTPYEDFMAICNKHRGSNGRLVIAIENKFGLKYWAGCREDHLGTFYSGLEGYPNGGSARTFTRNGLESIVKKVGISQYSFYYPYPDYKFTSVVYSDKYLPKKGELSTNLRNFDRDRMLTFDEKLVFDQIIEDGEFPMFSNSFCLVIGNTLETLYAKFSNDRAKPWAIQTQICQNPFGEMRVEKHADSKASLAHLETTFKAYEKLSKRYEGTKIVIDPCKKIGNYLVFDYFKGRTLEELLDDCLANADVDGFKNLIDEYITWLNYGSDKNVSNIDFIFPNIIVDGDKWQVIDYEWTFDRQVPVKEIAFRAFYNYLLGGESRRAAEDLLYRDTLALTDEEIVSSIQDEKDFQKYITGQRAAVGDMRELIGNPAYETVSIHDQFVLNNNKLAIAQVFWDDGTGFKEENSIKINNPLAKDQRLELEVDIPENVISVRIDPCSEACILNVRDIHTEKDKFDHTNVFVNGMWISDTEVLYATDDPIVVMQSNGARKLSFAMDILDMPVATANALVGKFHEKKGIKSTIKSIIS